MTEFQSIAVDASAVLEPNLTVQKAAAKVHCFHCGTRCQGTSFSKQERTFCCHGCLTVFELLAENGLTEFYSLDQNAGVRVSTRFSPDKFAYLDEPSVRERIVQYSDEKLTRVTFRLPAIHCIACVWLLENLFRFKSGIGQTQVNFLRKEASIIFETG